MFFLSTFFSTILLAILALAFYNTRWSIAFFIAYSLLAPVVRLNIVGLSLSDTVIYFFYIIIVCLKYRKRILNIRYTYFRPFFFFFLAFGFLIFIQPSELFVGNLWLWMRHAVMYLFYPMALFTTIYFERNALKNYMTAIKISLVVAVVYGFYLTMMPGINPYLMITLPVFDMEFSQSYALGYSSLTENYADSVAEGRMFGRISSVFPHPMTYTLNLGFFTIICTYLLKNKLKCLGLFALMMVFAMLFSGVRTVLAAMLFTIIWAAFNLGKLKPMLFMTTSLVMISLIAIYFFPSLYSYVESIWRSDEVEISGSSISVRIGQLMGCFDILKDNIMTGNGYSWVMHYRQTHEIHPVLLAFESLLFTTLCNTGIIGCVIWIITGVSYFSIIKRKVKDRYLQTMMLSLFCFYVVFSLITGDYGYMKYFMLYYAILLGFIINKKGRRISMHNKRI